MRHQVRTKKFRSGIDANQMLLRKLSRNFFEHGKITTTITKIKVLRPYVEKAVHLAKRNTEGSKNMLLRSSGNKKIVSLLISQVAPVFQSRQGGYVRIIRVGARQADGTEMGRLEWTLPVVFEKKEEKAEKKPEIKKTAKTSPQIESKIKKERSVKKVTAKQAK